MTKRAFAAAALVVMTACAPRALAESAGFDVVLPDAALLEKAQNIAASLNDNELAGQVIMTGVDACGSVSVSEAERLARVKPGAIMLFRKNLSTTNDAIRAMTAELAAAAALQREDGDCSPFIACDHEGGGVQRVRSAAARLPSPLSYDDVRREAGEPAALEEIRRDAERAGRELAGLGINLNLAPVAEALNDGNAAFLDDRAYGGDAAWTALAALAFMRGMETAGIACIAKHFPGNSAADPHKSLPVLRGGADELDEMASPFRVLAHSGVPAGIMAAHSVAAAWDAEHSASLSPAVLTGKLKEQFGCGGIVLADDFSMEAVAGRLDAANAVCAALAAGADMIMAWPANLAALHNAIRGALERGELPRERLRDAAARIIYQKLRFAGRGKPASLAGAA